MIWIQFAHHSQRLITRREGLDKLISYTQRPSCVGHDLFHTHSRMNRSEKRLAIFTEANHTERSDHRRRPRIRRQALRSPPAVTITVARRRDVSHAFSQPASIVREQHYCPLREARNIARAA